MDHLPAVVDRNDHPGRRLAAVFVRSRKSEHTRDAYQRDLTMWLNWCADRGVDPLDARAAHVQLWLADLADTGLSEATRARRLATLSSWYDWLVREDVVVRNPARLRPEERPRTQRDESPTPVLSIRQVERMLEVADRDRDPRVAAVFALLAYTGMRVTEMLDADVEDVTVDRGHPVLPIIGKGRKDRVVPLPPPVYERVERYLHSRTDGGDRLPATAAGVRPRRPLIATSRGSRVDRLQVRRTLRSLARRAGGDLAALADRISPHSLRHSYATDLLDDGVPVRDVQYAMGHADPRTTERYDRSRLRLDRHPTYRRAGQVTSNGPDQPS